MKTLIALLLSIATLPLLAQSQSDPITVQMRNGQIIRGSLEDLEHGTLYVRVSLHDQRQLQIGDIALIDRVGGAAGLPDTETNAARGPEHVMLFRNGGSIRGTLVDIVGGPGSGAENQERTYVFRQTDGLERRFAGNEVGRVYLGSYPFAADVTTAPGPLVASPPRVSNVAVDGVRVPATIDWVNTGLVVRRGQRMAFHTQGQVKLSSSDFDVAGVNGNSRFPANGPIPQVAAGGLIGRIGVNGQPFGIGGQPIVPMPGDGVLYLSVNDDQRADNSGEFVVAITAIDPRRR